LEKAEKLEQGNAMIKTQINMVKAQLQELVAVPENDP